VFGVLGLGDGGGTLGILGGIGFGRMRGGRGRVNGLPGRFGVDGGGDRRGFGVGAGDGFGLLDGSSLVGSGVPGLGRVGAIRAGWNALTRAEVLPSASTTLSPTGDMTLNLNPLDANGNVRNGVPNLGAAVRVTETRPLIAAGARPIFPARAIAPNGTKLHKTSGMTFAKNSERV